MIQLPGTQIHVISAADGDWHALYVDGKKVQEGHSLHWAFVLDALHVPYTHAEKQVGPYDEEDHFPKELKTP